VVGSILSVKHTWYAEGGAHPSYGTRFFAVDALTGQDVSLRTLFDDQTLFQALAADKVVKSHVTGESPPTTLDALLNALDGGCEMDLGPGMMTHYAFDDLDGSRVAVRIGLSHGCEVMRGNFTQIGVWLPVPAALAAPLVAADRDGALMEDAPRSG
jgi:hypothetical protein